MQHNHGYLELEYEKLLSLPQWKAKRKQILLRDCNKCRSCGTTNFLQVHHRQYHIVKSTGKFKDPWSYDETQLITLCSKCHKSGHKNYKVPLFIINN